MNELQRGSTGARSRSNSRSGDTLTTIVVSQYQCNREPPGGRIENRSQQMFSAETIVRTKGLIVDLLVEILLR